MQKKIFLIVIYFTLTGISVQAQNKKHLPPPPPPAPPAPIENLIAPPPPPPPPIPPIPPIPPASYEKEVIENVIVNENGYEISVRKLKGTQMVFLNKDGVTQKIKLSTWNANRKFYEKKYGQLPPPPPPPPAEELISSEPGNEKDTQ